jgi:uncharacterized protein YwgA
MEDFILDLVLYSILKLNETSLDFGKTMVHKIIYFSSSKDGRDKYYIPYYYGPYSEEVQNNLNELKYNSIIDITSTPKIKFSENYKNKIPSYLDRQTKKYPEYQKTFHNIEKIVKSISKKSLNTNEFSILAKIHLINERQLGNNGLDNISAKDIKYYSGYYNWGDFKNLSHEKIDNYIIELKNLLNT